MEGSSPDRAAHEQGRCLMWQLVTQVCALHVWPRSIPGLCLAEECPSTFVNHSHTTPSVQKSGNQLAWRERGEANLPRHGLLFQKRCQGMSGSTHSPRDCFRVTLCKSEYSIPPRCQRFHLWLKQNKTNKPKQTPHKTNQKRGRRK